MNLGQALRSVRLELGQSQRAAAAMVGISHVHQCNLENGKSSPTLTILEKFRAAWGVDVYLWAVGVDPETPQALAHHLIRHNTKQLDQAKRKLKT